MKAVFFHADAHFPDGKPVGDIYRRLAVGFKRNCQKFGLKTVHLTLEGHEGWGDETIFLSGLDPRNIMLNREIAFCDFLEKAPEDVYWFTEPDYRIWRPWPKLKADVALLYRVDDVPINPAWRMATKKALPLFRLFLEETKKVELRPGVGWDWHCDSEGFRAVWARMGKADEFLGIKIEWRPFEDYIKPDPIYGGNFAGDSKSFLLEKEGL